MTFWEHLDALRKVLFRVAGIWLVLAIAFFIAMPWLFDHVVMAPCHDDFIFYRFLHWIGNNLGMTGEFFTRQFEVKLININLAAPFLIHMTTAFWMSVVVSAPYLFYQVWGFIRPGLYERESRHVRRALGIGTVMFFLGVLLGYLMVFPLTLRFLATYELSSAIENSISLNSYIDNFMMLILMMGVVFELPLVTWLLSMIGVVNKRMLGRYRRHAILVIFAVAAVITPTGDPFTLAVVAVPLCLLYELSVLLIKEKKKDE